MALVGFDGMPETALTFIARLKQHVRAGAPNLPVDTSRTTQHVIGQAVAVARLIGVPTAVHMRQVERPDGPQRAARAKEFADRGEAANLDAENVLAAGEDM